MRVGAGIYEHTDGRFEARYRKGRKPDGTIIYGSVYGKTYKEAEKRRAELLHQLALKAENGESDEAAVIFESNRNIRDFYTPDPRGKASYPEPLTEADIEALIPSVRKCYPGFRLAFCLALYMGISGEALAALRWSDIDISAGTLTVSEVMIDAKHMFGTVIPCEKRTLPITQVIYDFVDLPACTRQNDNRYILTESGERIKTLRSAKILWSKTMSACGYEGKFTPELLRATFIRRALENGMNFETVAAITALSPMTLRAKYGHYALANTSLLLALDGAMRPKESSAKRMKLLIIGAGSHGRAVYEIAEKLGIFEKISFLDDSATDDGIIGKTDDFLQYRDEYPICFIAIEDNKIRRTLSEKVTAAGFITPRLISSEASIARGAVIGRGTVIMPQATVSAEARIGDFCIIAGNSMIGFNATVGDCSHCDCACVVMNGCTVPAMTTVDSGEIVKKQL